MNFPITANLILLIAFSILIFLPFLNNDKLYNQIKLQSLPFSISVGVFFAAMAIVFHFLSPELANGIFSNSRILLILYSGLIGGPLAVLTSSSLIVITRDLLGSLSDLTIIMKWHTLFTGILLALFAMYKPITLKNLHYYYAITLIQFSAVIFICYLIYDAPMSSLFTFIVFFIVAYIIIYFILKKYNDMYEQLLIMKQLHMKDYLTKLPNNLATEDYLHQILDKKIPFELLHIDIDLFKIFNAEQTYRVGDEVLRQMADVLKRISEGKNAYVGHTGGDEFCIILTNSNPATAVHVAYEINRAVNETAFHYNAKTFSLSVSICVCSYPQNGHTLEELYSATINGLKVITSTKTNVVVHVNQLKQEGTLT